MSKFFLNIWYLLVGFPAELTYWFEGAKNTIHVRKFKEVKPNHIMFQNIETEKYVIVKSDIPIKYIIKED